MNMEAAGKAIADARRKSGMTQEQLAERVGVTVQAVSKWETGRNLPDIENLMTVCEITNTPYRLILEADDTSAPPAFRFRERLFQEENMYTRMRSFAAAEHLEQTYRALPYMKQQHLGQFRKEARNAPAAVHYINHPLMMACHAHALGIRDDALLAAILLHDVVEDTSTQIGDLPFSQDVRDLVALVTFNVPEGMTKEEAKDLYYRAISRNAEACVIKLLDRCSNVSTMAESFPRKKLLAYVEETETFILPLADVLKDSCLKYSDAAFLVKYQIISILEAVKNLLVD